MRVRSLQSLWVGFLLNVYTYKKLMISPGGPHEMMAGRFGEAFLQARLSQGIGLSQLIPYRAKLYRLTRGIGKEPDDSFVPATRETDDYPSFVVEIGASESLNKLRQDARLWLTKTNDWARLVLIIKINKRDSTLVFERWQRVPRPPSHPGPRTRSQDAYGPRCIQTVVVNYANYPAHATVQGAPLHLPVHLIFDDVPQGIDLASNITIGEADFRAFGNVFGQRHL